MHDIAFHADDQQAQDDHLASALMLALKFEARLSAVYSLVFPDLPTYAEVEIPRDVLARYREQANKEAAELEQSFLHKAELAGVRARWCLVRKPAAQALMEQARCTDLLIMSQSPPGSAALDDDLLAGEVALGAGRPVLMLPHSGSELAIGGHVMVAWDGSREATRAVNDAMPWLQRATTVSLVQVGAARPPEHGSGVEAVREYLAVAGIDAGTHFVEQEAGHAGRALLKWADDADVGLLVMGAFGRSSLREWVFGGVTEHVVREASLPVLLSH